MKKTNETGKVVNREELKQIKGGTSTVQQYKCCNPDTGECDACQERTACPEGLIAVSLGCPS